MSDDNTNKRMSTGIGLFSDIRVHEIHVSLFSYSVTIQHRAKKKIHSKLQFNWQTYLERFTDWWLNEHFRRAHISFLSVFLNIKLHVSFLHNNNLSSGQLVRFLLSFWTEVASSPSQSCRSLPSLSVKWIEWLDN